MVRYITLLLNCHELRIHYTCTNIGLIYIALNRNCEVSMLKKKSQYRDDMSEICL